MGKEKIKAIELIIDWNLWPRFEAGKLDSANLRRMREALEVGIKLPPVIVDRKSYRIIDGVHRVNAYLDVFGDEAEIEVEFRDYKNEAAMYLDAGALNAAHGLPLSPKDMAHFISGCRKRKIPPIMVATALGMDKEKMEKFFTERTAVTRTGERIAIGYGASHLSQAKLGSQKLNTNQENFARTADGTRPMLHARQLLKALRANALSLTESDIKLLHELMNEIKTIIRRAA